MGRAVKIIELTGTQRPQKLTEAGQTERERYRDQKDQPVHRAALPRRSELAITTSELSDIESAAIIGVTNPAMAKGTASTL